MDQYLPHFEFIDKERSFLIKTLTAWTNIHSGSENLGGLAEMLGELKNSFSKFEGVMEEHVLPPRVVLSRDGSYKELELGKALTITKHPKAPIQVLLVGHMDIAYSAHLSLEKCQHPSRDIIMGRGSADMKSGLLVALLALRALEQSPFVGKVGWKMLINPDEEIGSPGSKELLLLSAKHRHLGLIFEPSMPDGTLVSGRKGSANFTIAVKGKAAHAGREFFNGLNALTSAARFALAVESLTDFAEDVSVNVGYLEGGGPVNIVPDQAVCRLNIRVKTKEELIKMKEKIEDIAEIENNRGGIKLILYQDSERPPKIFDKKTKILFDALKKCGAPLGIKIGWKSAGGVCDGNTLAEAGLVTIDTLGGVGGNLHTSEEYVSINSMIQRAKLVARFLMQIAAGEVMLN